MGSALYRKIGIASLIMMASVLASRVIGLVREMVIASAGGATGDVDAYQIAFILPEILNHVVASGFLSVTFIPIFARYQASGDEAGGWHVFSLILTVFGTLLVVLILAAEYLAPLLVRLLAPGVNDPCRLARAVEMTRIILPAQFFFFTGSLFMAVQFARERFSIPALAPLVYNLGIVFGGICLNRSHGMAGFSWGVLAGAFLGNFGLQWYGAHRCGMRFRPCWNIRHPELLNYLLTTLPLMLGLTMIFSTEVFIKLFGSYLPGGSIASLNYALRVEFILVALVGQAVGVASYPFMARLVAQKRVGEMVGLLDTLLRHLALVIPLSALIMVLRREIVLLLFQRGRFDPAATDLTAEALVWLMVGAVAFAAQTVVVRGFYAMGNTLLPSLLGTLAVLVSIPLYLAGIETMGIAGVALACSLAAILQVALLYGAWNRRIGNHGWRAVMGIYGKMVGLGLIVGPAAAAVRSAVLTQIDGRGFSGSLIVVLATASTFALLLIAAGRLLNIEEINGTVSGLWGRVKRAGRGLAGA
jgi:putative peptidoglycan lipid II flippase